MTVVLLQFIPYNVRQKVKMNVAGLVLGVIAWLFALLPIFGPFITIPSSVAGMALSSSFLAGRHKRGKRKQKGRQVALLGLTFAVAALPVMVIRTVSLW